MTAKARDVTFCQFSSTLHHKHMRIYLHIHTGVYYTHIHNHALCTCAHTRYHCRELNYIPRLASFIPHRQGSGQVEVHSSLVCGSLWHVHMSKTAHIQWQHIFSVLHFNIPPENPGSFSPLPWPMLLNLLWFHSPICLPLRSLFCRP